MEVRELSWRERGRLWIRLGIRLALVALAALLLVYVAPPLISLLAPFLLALLLAWILNPLIRSIQQRLGLSRRLLSLVLILMLLAIVGVALAVLGYNVVSEVISLANNWQGIWNGILSVLDSLGTWASGLFDHLPAGVESSVSGMLESLIGWVQSAVPSLLNRLMSGAGSVAFSVPSFAVSVVVFVMGSYFITADYPRLRDSFSRMLSPEVEEFLSQVKRTAMAGFGGYIRAQLILATVVFFILLAGFFLMGQPYAVLLAFLLAVLDFIPIVGSGTIMVPWAVICLFTGQFGTAVQLMAIWGVIAVFRQVAEPRIVGNQTGLSPILSLISIYVGMRLAGVAGMILGPVTTMVIINICKLGVLDGITADLRLAARDLSALLKNRPDPDRAAPGAPDDGPDGDSGSP